MPRLIPLLAALAVLAACADRSDEVTSLPEPDGPWVPANPPPSVSIPAQQPLPLAASPRRGRWTSAAAAEAAADAR